MVCIKWPNSWKYCSTLFNSTQSSLLDELKLLIDLNYKVRNQYIPNSYFLVVQERWLALLRTAEISQHGSYRTLPPAISVDTTHLKRNTAGMSKFSRTWKQIKVDVANPPVCITILHLVLHSERRKKCDFVLGTDYGGMEVWKLSAYTYHKDIFIPFLSLRHHRKFQMQEPLKKLEHATCDEFQGKVFHDFVLVHNIHFLFHQRHVVSEVPELNLVLVLEAILCTLPEVKKRIKL